MTSRAIADAFNARLSQECTLQADSDCPAACRCNWRPEGNVSLVHCAAAGLSAPPVLRGELLVADRLLLDLSGNRLTALPAPDTLPPILDVRSWTRAEMPR